MRESGLGTSVSKYRDLLAILVLLAIVSLAPFVTSLYNSVQTNSLVAGVQVVFFLVAFRGAVEQIRGVTLDPKHFMVSIFVFSALFIVLASLLFNEASGRSFFYVANVLFFFSLVWFFSKYESSFGYILIAKVLSVFLICLIFLGMRVYQGESFYDHVFGRPDIYRHLRHLNYDLMAGIGAMFLLVALGRFRAFSFYSVIFVFSVLLMWTGGRGQFVSLLIFIFGLFFTKFRKLAASVLPVLALACALVVVSGETNFLFGQMEKTLESPTLNNVSSGRLKIWSDAWTEGLNGGLLGHGADSYREFTPYNIVQPHNSIVQFMFEYGIVGLILWIVFLSWTSLICVRRVLDKKSSGSVKVLSSFVLSMYAYSLVDGIFYHAIPFSFMVIIAAAFFVELRRKNSKGSAVQGQRCELEKA